MRCTTCQYALWNLTTRQCPECGAPFSPDEFDFVPNTIRFMCPHCGQAYYGTGARGHLVPVEFECTRCGRAVHMNEMALLPAEGLREEQTEPLRNPWLERRRIGRWKAWFSTIGSALVRPGRLIDGTPETGRAAEAWWFAALTQVAMMIASILPAFAIVLFVPLLAPAGGGGPGAGYIAAMMAGGVAFASLAAIVFLFLFIAVWGLTIQLALLISGPRPAPLRRTYEVVCYSSGCNVLTALPCMGQYVGFPWWVVSAVLMVRQAHGTGGLRATFAAAAFPVGLVALFVALYVSLLAFAFTVPPVAAPGTAGVPAAFSTGTPRILSALRAARARDGAWPAHAVELVDAGDLTAWDLVAGDTATTVDDVPVADVTLAEFARMDAPARRAVRPAAVAALPGDVVAHRLGDFVFTYHGVDPQREPGTLWVVIMWPDPAVNAPPARGSMIAAGRADGTVTTLRADELQEQLDRQNALRAGAGLAPLPHPGTVWHGRPARPEEDAPRP